MAIDRWIRVLGLRVRSLLDRGQMDQELDEELQFHLDRATDEHIRRGLSVTDARAAARRALGGVEQRKEEMRDARQVAVVEHLLRDIRLGVRQLGRQRAFALAAVISLALGIGANVTIFQVFAALSLRPLPVDAAHELVEIRLIGGGRAGRHTGRIRQISRPQYDELARRQQAFASLAAVGDTRFNLSSQGEIRYAEGLWVSGNFFDTLRVSAVVGRLIAPADDQPGCQPAAVISHALWQSHFGGRSDILGQTIPFGAGRVPILGVTPPEFFGVEVGRQFGVAMPLCASGFARRDHWWLAAIGRLNRGWTRAQAQGHLDAIMPAVQQTTLPDYRGELADTYLAMKADVVDAAAGLSPLREGYERPLWILLAIAALVLLIATVNLANLQLARAAVRAPEFAVRLALGGSRVRVLQQVLIECLLVAGLGMALALAVAWGTSRLIPPLISTAADPVYLDVSLDWRSLAFTGLAGLVACLLFGLAPALRATRATVLRAGPRGVAGHERATVRRTLAGLQVAVTVVLLAGSLLFLQTFRNLIDLDLGVKPDDVVVANVFFPERQYPPEARRVAYGDVDERLAALPGVLNVSEAFTTPLGGSFSDRSIRVDGEVRGDSYVNWVSPGYFAALGTPLRAGRDFDARDVPDSPRVAIVNEAFATLRLGGRALGARFTTVGVGPDPDTEYEVVGLVANQKYLLLREPFPPIFYPASTQIPTPGLTRRYVLRSAQPAAQTIAAIGALLREVEPDITVRYAPLERQIGEAMLQERLMARLSLMFGSVALALALVGLYGVVAYGVASRRGEIGVRVALGARRWRIVTLVLGDVGLVLAGGLAVGLIVTLAVTRAVSSLLFGISHDDPAVLGMAVLILGATGLMAAAIPARRAAAIDPVQTLRE